MKKIILLLLITQSIFAQSITKEALIEKVSESTCKCATDKKITKENLDFVLGGCIIEAISKYDKEIEVYYGKDILGNEEKMTELAESIGAKLVFTCPSFLEIITQMSSEELGDVDESEEDLYINGKISNIKSDQFLTFTVKEDSGKTHSILLLEKFENSFLITDSVIKPTDNVKVSYYDAVLFDAKIKKFVTYKVVLDIIKK